MARRGGPSRRKGLYRRVASRQPTPRQAARLASLGSSQGHAPLIARPDSSRNTKTNVFVERVAVVAAEPMGASLLSNWRANHVLLCSGSLQLDMTNTGGAQDARRLKSTVAQRESSQRRPLAITQTHGAALLESDCRLIFGQVSRIFFQTGRSERSYSTDDIRFRELKLNSMISLFLYKGPMICQIFEQSV